MAKQNIGSSHLHSSFPSIFSWIKNKPYETDNSNRKFESFTLGAISYPKQIEGITKETEVIKDLPEYDQIHKAIVTCKDMVKDHNEVNPYLLVSGDLSGIQDTVYSISSKGALKSLRARSFMLEFLCEHVCCEIVSEVFGDYKQYRNHVIFSGGGSFCLLLPNIEKTIQAFSKIKEVINNWAFEEFSGKLFVAIVSIKLSDSEAEINENNEGFRKKWNELSDELESDKKRKFSWKLKGIFDESNLKEPVQHTNKTECQICHRDDIDDNNSFYNIETLKKVIDFEKEAEDNGVVHPLCYQLLLLGDDLTKADKVYRHTSEPSAKGYLKFPGISSLQVFYSTKVESDFYWEINGTNLTQLQFLFANYVTKNEDLPEEIKKKAFNCFKEDYQIKHTSSFESLSQTKQNELSKNFYERTADFENLASCSRGANLIACLRMDVDNMGRIFSEDLKIFNLVTLANLSKMLNIFFKIYLNKICECNPGSIIGGELNITSKDYSKGRKVSIVYSGGDDLFIVGAWDEVAELAYDIQKCFKEFSGLGISAGLTLHKPNFPLYQIAKQSASALNESKYSKKYLEYMPRKNKFAVFFKYSKKERNDALLHLANTNILNGKHDYRDKLEYCIEWSDNNTLSIVSKFKEMCIVENNRLKLQGISKAFFRKLFGILEVWWTRNIMYVPDLLRLFDERINKLNKNKNVQENLRDLRDMLVKMPLANNSHEGIKSLSIPLTWIELLLRDKGE
jgi:CRISPR-associated protein Csm1